MTLAALTTFLGWTVVVHFGLIIFATLMIVVMRNWVPVLHGRMFGIAPDTVRKLIYQWLGTYKLMIFVFALVPWVALKLM